VLDTTVTLIMKLTTAISPSASSVLITPELKTSILDVAKTHANPMKLLFAMVLANHAEMVRNQTELVECVFQSEVTI